MTARIIFQAVGGRRHGDAADEHDDADGAVARAQSSSCMPSTGKRREGIDQPVIARRCARRAASTKRVGIGKFGEQERGHDAPSSSIKLAHLMHRHHRDEAHEDEEHQREQAERAERGDASPRSWG